jgi:hypothetical protein
MDDGFVGLLFQLQCQSVGSNRQGCHETSKTLQRERLPRPNAEQTLNYSRRRDYLAKLEVSISKKPVGSFRSH